eukprot:8170287-Prorocentrum_lima.AAC.1
MKLKKSGYGLNDAPLGWQREADRRLQKAGFQPHPLDNCCYVSYNKEGKFDGFVLLYVDDLLGMGDEHGCDEKCYQQRCCLIQEYFKLRKMDYGSKLSWLGSVLEKRGDGYVLHQTAYAKKLSPVTVEKDRLATPESVLRPRELTRFQGLLGALQWASSQTAAYLQSSTSMLGGH